METFSVIYDNPVAKVVIREGETYLFLICPPAIDEAYAPYFMGTGCGRITQKGTGGAVITLIVHKRNGLAIDYVNHMIGADVSKLYKNKVKLVVPPQLPGINVVMEPHKQEEQLEVIANFKLAGVYFVKNPQFRRLVIVERNGEQLVCIGKVTFDVKEDTAFPTDWKDHLIEPNKLDVAYLKAKIVLYDFKDTGTLMPYP
ncbi:Hypothetical protein POVN_LOCUS78 [uncultured virus]|nr:Hypothetical protein POVN_LOCUS78 [uncultured virus]